MKRNWKRRNYFIKKELQGKYIFSFFLFVIAGSITFTLIFSLLSADTLTIVYDNYNLRIGKTPSVLFKEILSAHWIFIVAGGLIVVVLSMFLTHRFAGPIFRFERSIEEVTRGNLNFQIKLREKDEGKELASRINEMILALSSNYKEIRDLSSEIRTLLAAALEESKIPGRTQEAARHIEVAGDLSRRLCELLQRFTLKDNK